jgi:hypothetical protein
MASITKFSTVSRILLGVTAWCPNQLERHQRATDASEWLAQMRGLREKSRESFDFVIIDNGAEHPLLRQAIGAWEREPQTLIERPRPQLGWAGGRNRIIEIFMDGRWDRLVLIDQDMFVAADDWIEKIARLTETDPGLLAYMMCVNERHVRGEAVLPSGTRAIIMKEFLGGINILSRDAIEKVGGYDTRSFPEHWGWHDILYGRALRAAGLLEYAAGNFVDPVRVPTVHRNSSLVEPSSIAYHNRLMAEYSPVFFRREAEVARGQGIYNEYRKRVA